MFKNDNRAIWSLPAVLTAMGLPLGSALAQEQQAVGGLEEIVVTARRMEESVQDIPLSVAAFTGDEMELRGMERVADVVAGAPNVMISGGPSTARNTFAMRGINGAAFFVDGVWQQSNIALDDRNVLELDRVEILRGPQGTLFGRDTTGGAIMLYTKLPEEEFGMRVTGTIGEYSRRDLSATLDIPLAENLLSKFTLASAQRNGFVQSVIVDRAYGEVDDQLLRGDLLWTPSDNLTMRLTMERSEQRSTQANYTLHIIDPGSPGVVAGEQPLFVGTTPMWVATHQYYELLGLEYSCRTHVPLCPGGELGDLETKSDYNEGPGLITDYDNVNLRFEWDIGDNMTLMSLTSYQGRGSWDYNNFDNSEFDFFSQGSVQEADTVSQEFQFSGDSANGRFHWVSGVYYWDFQQMSHFMRWSLWEFDPNNTGPNTLDFSQVQGHPLCKNYFVLDDAGEFVRDEDGDQIRAPGAFGINCRIVPVGHQALTETRQTGYAVFGNAIYDITDTLSLTLGARYHDQENTTWSHERHAGAPGRDNVPGRLQPGDHLVSIRRFNERTNAFDHDTYRIALENQFTDNLMAYFGFHQAANSGGVSRVTVRDHENIQVVFDFPYDPEYINNYELGVRSDWADNRLRFNATYFKTDWEDIIVNGIARNPFTGEQLPQFLRQNQASAEAKGVELEFTYVPTPNWQIEADVATLDTGYTEVAPGADLRIDAPFGLAPELSYAIAAQWTGNTANNGEIMVRLDYNWRDGFHRHYVPEEWSTTHTGEEWEQDAYGLAAARLVYRPPEGNWELALFGTNLTDERYSNSGFLPGILQIDDGTIGRPREVGLTMKVFFD